MLSLSCSRHRALWRKHVEGSSLRSTQAYDWRDQVCFGEGGVTFHADSRWMEVVFNYWLSGKTKGIGESLTSSLRGWRQSYDKWLSYLLRLHWATSQLIIRSIGILFYRESSSKTQPHQLFRDPQSHFVLIFTLSIPLCNSNVSISILWPVIVGHQRSVLCS